MDLFASSNRSSGRTATTGSDFIFIPFFFFFFLRFKACEEQLAAVWGYVNEKRSKALEKAMEDLSQQQAKVQINVLLSFFFFFFFSRSICTLS
jgi:hypothetical protein